MDERPLPASLSLEPGAITVVLFSQPQCVFCAEIREHYLRPLAASGRRGVAVAEVGLEAKTPVRDWSGRPVVQSDFARALGVRFAPTVMFFDGKGRSVAAPIVGLSQDYFGAYLEQRIATALQAAKSPRVEPPAAAS